MSFTRNMDFAQIMLYAFWIFFAGLIYYLPPSSWMRFFGWLLVLLSTFLINHFELFGLQQAHQLLPSFLSKQLLGLSKRTLVSRPSLCWSLQRRDRCGTLSHLRFSGRCYLEPTRWSTASPSTSGGIAT